MREGGRERGGGIVREGERGRDSEGGRREGGGIVREGGEG